MISFDEHFSKRPGTGLGGTVEVAINHFKALFGMDLDYYGADEADSTFKVDGIVFKALEDPDDGYRSYLGAIDYSEQHSSIFFKSAIARVRLERFEIEKRDDEDSMHVRAQAGYRLVDLDDDHIWLTFGTDYYDDYYPYFIFKHTPKEGVA